MTEYVIIVQQKNLSGGCGSSHSKISGDSANLHSQVKSLLTGDWEKNDASTIEGNATASATLSNFTTFKISFSEIEFESDSRSANANVTVKYDIASTADSNGTFSASATEEMVLSRISDTEWEINNSSTSTKITVKFASLTSSQMNLTISGKNGVLNGSSNANYNISCTMKKTSSTSGSVNDLWNGGWLYQSGKVKGITMGTDFNVLQFAVFLESSDVSEATGSATISAILCLSADSTMGNQTAHFRIPMLIDQETVTTKLKSDYEWTATTEHGVFSLDINPDTLVANFTGYTSGTSTDISFDIVVKKYTGDAAVNVKDFAGDSTWTVTSEDASGGFISVSSLNGLALMQYGYLNAAFSNVDISKRTAHIVATVAMPATVGMGTYQATQSQNVLLPLILSHDITLKHIFGTIYRFDIPSKIQPTKGIIIIEPTNKNKGTIIINSTTTNMSANVMFHAQKKSGTEVDIKTINDATWTADGNYADRVGGILVSMDYPSSTTPTIAPLTMSENNPFEVSFDADVSNAKITVSAGGIFNVGNVTSVDVGVLINRLAGGDSVTLGVKKVGFNTYYAEGTKSTFAVVLQDNESAYVFAEIMPTGNKVQEVCSLAGYMKKE